MKDKDKEFEPRIVAFCCHYCAYGAADLAGVMRLQYPPNVRIIHLPCSGAIDVIYILRAFELGADGVIVAGCLEGTCHFLEGNYRARERVEYAKSILREIGLGDQRLEMFLMSAAEGPVFARVIREMTERIRELGPSPLNEGRQGQ